MGHRAPVCMPLTILFNNLFFLIEFPRKTTIMLLKGLCRGETKLPEIYRLEGKLNDFEKSTKKNF